MKKNLVAIEKMAKNYSSLDEVKKELKRLQSLKCNLLKQKYLSNYDEKLTKILQNEQMMKEVRNLFVPKKKFVTDFTQADVDMLDYDETVKAIKSIQSKKARSKYTTEEPGQSDEFKSAEQIEQMLIEHRDQIQPVDESLVRKTEVQTIIDTLESSGDLSKEAVLELLKKLQ